MACYENFNVRRKRHVGVLNPFILKMNTLIKDSSWLVMTLIIILLGICIILYYYYYNNYYTYIVM
jgi:hypothetical protein